MRPTVPGSAALAALFAAVSPRIAYALEPGSPAVDAGLDGAYEATP